MAHYTANERRSTRKVQLKAETEVAGNEDTGLEQKADVKGDQANKMAQKGGNLVTETEFDELIKNFKV